MIDRLSVKHVNIRDILFNNRSIKQLNFYKFGCFLYIVLRVTAIYKKFEMLL